MAIGSGFGGWRSQKAHINKVNDLRQGLQLGFGEGVIHKVCLYYLTPRVSTIMVQKPLKQSRRLLFYVIWRFRSL